MGVDLSNLDLATNKPRHLEELALAAGKQCGTPTHLSAQSGAVETSACSRWVAVGEQDDAENVSGAGSTNKSWQIISDMVECSNFIV